MLLFNLPQRFGHVSKAYMNYIIKCRLLSSYSDLLKSSLNYVNGNHEPSLSKDCLEVIEPATGATLCHIADSDVSDVSSAVESAKVAFKLWSALSGSERSIKLMKAAQLLRSNLEEISRAEVKHTGKCIWEARLDTEGCASVLEYYAGVAPTIQGDHINLAGGSFAYLRREPLGVCGGIGAWNYPLQMAVWKSAPALACGNTMVFKPSNQTPLTAVMLAEIYCEAGLPPGCFNVVQGGALAGQMLCSHPDVKKMSFTGSVGAGSKVMSTSAKTIKYVTLELGGKSPLVIFNDADIDDAVSGALMANFLSQGQVCSNGTRVLVQRQIYEEFVQKFVQRTKAMKIGNPLAEDSKVGAMINTQHGLKVLTFVNDAIQQGAKVECGGVRVHMADESLAGGFYMSPCVLTNVKDDMVVAREEIFGPVACVFPFDSEEEALRRANDSQYGLASGVFTKDIQRAHRFAANIEAGNVYINNYNVYPVELPFGGFKQSGIGRECGLAVIQHYTQLKTVYVEMGKVLCPL